VNPPNEVRIPAASIPGNGSARAILREVERLLTALLEDDEGASIDIHAMGLGEADYALLEEELGVGEVRAEVENLGPTRLYETGLPGVWWVNHYNEAGALVAEFLEVAYCTDILITPVEDVREGLGALRGRLLEDRQRGKGIRKGEG